MIGDGYIIYPRISGLFVRIISMRDSVEFVVRVGMRNELLKLIEEEDGESG